MTAEQVLRCAILKQYRELTYEELAFHLEDSMAFRSFALLDMGQYPCGATLQDNIKAFVAKTWEAGSACPRGRFFTIWRYRLGSLPLTLTNMRALIHQDTALPPLKAIYVKTI